MVQGSGGEKWAKPPRHGAWQPFPVSRVGLSNVMNDLHFSLVYDMYFAQCKLDIFAISLSYTLAMKKDMAYKIVSTRGESYMHSTNLLGCRDTFRNRRMGDRSVRSLDFEPKILSQKRRSFLSHQQGRRVGIRAQVIRANTQVDAFQILSSVDIETGVDDTTLVSRFHGASS